MCDAYLILWNSKSLHYGLFREIRDRDQRGGRLGYPWMKEVTEPQVISGEELRVVLLLDVRKDVYRGVIQHSNPAPRGWSEQDVEFVTMIEYFGGPCYFSGAHVFQGIDASKKRS